MEKYKFSRRVSGVAKKLFIILKCNRILLMENEKISSKSIQMNIYHATF